MIYGALAKSFAGDGEALKEILHAHSDLMEKLKALAESHTGNDFVATFDEHKVLNDLFKDFLQLSAAIEEEIADMIRILSNVALSILEIPQGGLEGSSPPIVAVQGGKSSDTKMFARSGSLQLLPVQVVVREYKLWNT